LILLRIASAACQIAPIALLVKVLSVMDTSVALTTAQNAIPISSKLQRLFQYETTRSASSDRFFILNPSLLTRITIHDSVVCSLRIRHY